MADLNALYSQNMADLDPLYMQILDRLRAMGYEVRENDNSLFVSNGPFFGDTAIHKWGCGGEVHAYRTDKLRTFSFKDYLEELERSREEPI